jgi:hypothetical protein
LVLLSANTIHWFFTARQLSSTLTSVQAEFNLSPPIGKVSGSEFNGDVTSNSIGRIKVSSIERSTNLLLKGRRNVFTTESTLLIGGTLPMLCSTLRAMADWLISTVISVKSTNTMVFIRVIHPLDNEA